MLSVYAELIFQRISFLFLVITAIYELTTTSLDSNSNRCHHPKTFGIISPCSSVVSPKLLGKNRDGNTGNEASDIFNLQFWG